MSLVAAKCTQCGSNIEVDDTKEAGICSHCGTAFITEKVINNITVNQQITIQNAIIHNVTTNSKTTSEQPQQKPKCAERKKANILLYALIGTIILSIMFAILPITISKNQYDDYKFVNWNAPIINLDTYHSNETLHFANNDWQTDTGAKDTALQRIADTNFTTTSPIYLTYSGASNGLGGIGFQQARHQIMIQLVVPIGITSGAWATMANSFRDMLQEQYTIVQGYPPITDFTHYFTGAMSQDKPLYVISAGFGWSTFWQGGTTYRFKMPYLGSNVTKESVINMLIPTFDVIDDLPPYTSLYAWGIYLPILIILIGGGTTVYLSLLFKKQLVVAQKKEKEIEEKVSKTK